MRMMFEIVDSIGDKFVKAIDKELKISENLEMQKLLAKYSTVSEVFVLTDCDLTRKKLPGCHFKRRFRFRL